VRHNLATLAALRGMPREVPSPVETRQGLRRVSLESAAYVRDEGGQLESGPKGALGSTRSCSTWSGMAPPNRAVRRAGYWHGPGRGEDRGKSRRVLTGLRRRRLVHVRPDGTPHSAAMGAECPSDRSIAPIAAVTANR
jgi:hypothetical protein